jgi:hypothetical protein
VIFGVDHLVLCGGRGDLARLRARLSTAGFAPVPGRLRFDAIGAHSESVAYRGGGFVEVVYEVVPGKAPRPWFDGPVPRVIGLGVSSDEFERDTAGSQWTMDEEQRLDDGSVLRIHAAGPNEHRSELYLFAMDRPDRELDHPGLGATSELVALTFSGRGSERWRQRLARWLGSSDAIGHVQLRFLERPGPVAVSPTFRVSSAPGTVLLASGAIELQGASG